MRGCITRAEQQHRSRTDERNRTLDGSGGSDDVPGFHDEAFEMKMLG